MLTYLIKNLNKIDKFYSQISTFKTVEEIISNQNDVSSILRSVLNEYINQNVGITTLAACSRLLCKTEVEFISKSHNQFSVLDKNNLVHINDFENRLFKDSYHLLYPGWMDGMNVYRPLIESSNEIENRIINSTKIEKRKIVSDNILISIIFDKIDRLKEDLYIDTKDFNQHYFEIKHGGFFGVSLGLLSSIPIIGNVLVPPTFQQIAWKYGSDDKSVIFLDICREYIIDDKSKSTTDLLGVLAQSLNNFDNISFSFYNSVEKYFPLLFKLNSFDLNYLFLNISPKSRNKHTNKFSYFHSTNRHALFGLKFDDPERLLLSE